MKYNKVPLTISDQIERLKARGLVILDEAFAAHHLARISFYRLRAYTYPFQDNSNDQHPFIKKISFEEIIALYDFDSKLRLLIFEAIEKIEVALRTQIIYHFSLAHGGHWHLKPELFRDVMRFANHLDSLQTEVDRSIETFIDHYKRKYSDPKEPPCWMGLEISSLGLLSKIFHNLRKSPEKQKVVQFFGLKDLHIFENWLLCISILRNICAHHGRIWNRRITPIKLPYNTLSPFLKNLNVYPNKLYATLACIQYMLNRIKPEMGFSEKLTALIRGNSPHEILEMGFPDNWQQDKFWQQ